MTPSPWPIPAPLASQLVGAAHRAVAFYGRRCSDHDRLDIAQDALSSYVEHMQKGDRIANPVAWVVRVVRNRCATWCRTARREAQAQSRWHDESAAGQEGREPAYREDEWAALARKFAEKSPPLSARDMDVVFDFAAGKRRRQIARRLGVTADVLEGWVKRNSKRLRFLIEQSDVNSGGAG